MSGAAIVQIVGIQACILGVAVVDGLAAGGAMRGAEVLFGPMRVVSVGLLIVGTVEGVRRAQEDPTHLSAALALLCLLLSGVALLWGLAVVTLPTAVGEALLGASWEATSKVAPLYALWALTLAPALVAAVGLRILGRAASVLRIWLLTSSVLAIVATLAAGVSGVRASLAGMAIVTAAASIVLWQLCRRQIRTQRTEPTSQRTEIAPIEALEHQRIM
jgi:hypothetical protein